METHQTDLFHFEDEKPNFEEMGHTNAERYWYARDFMCWLGYENYNSFRAVINRAISACTALNISVADNFIQTEREIDGQKRHDFKLKRFACYLIAMNGDPKKPKVAKTQTFFEGIPDLRRSLLDFMGKEELASNLFRITQTEAKIRKDDIRGQEKLEITAETVGQQVRKAIWEISGNRPEDLPIADDIKQVAKELKQTHKKLKKIDKS